MRSALAALLIVSCLVSCKSIPPEEPLVLLREWGSIRVSSKVSINLARSAANFAITNESTEDVVCDSMSIRGVYDNPDTYLESGEKVISLGNVFLRARATLTNTIDLPEGGFGRSQIRAASALEAGQHCRVATLLDYCRFASKSPLETKFLGRLFVYWQADTCEQLGERLNHAQDLNFGGWGVIAARPLIYLRSLRSVKADNNDGNAAVRVELISKTQTVFLDRVELVSPAALK